MRNYTIVNSIGSGSFGHVYKGVHKFKLTELVAIKRESVMSNFLLLRQEAKIYQYLSNTPGIAELKWFGRDNDYYYLVTELLGVSLSNYNPLMKKNNITPSINLIGCKLLNLIENLHNHLIIHRDVKPDNFLFERIDDTSLNLSSKLFVIDFGISVVYKNDGVHMPCELTNGLIGSPNFASLHAHGRTTLSRRDDLESIGYVLLFLMNNNSLPWQAADNEIQLVEIKQSWVQWAIEQRGALPIGEFMHAIQKLLFEDTPNYDKLRSLFTN